MLTPKYGNKKQFLYRNVVSEKIFLSYNKNKTLRVVSLGGIHCLDNPMSIENKILQRNDKNIIILVEKDKKCFRILQKKVKNNQRVKLFYGTLNNYFRQAVKLSFLRFDVLIADYYSMFNNNVVDDIELLFSRKLLAKQGTAFITVCQANRQINAPAIQRIRSYCPNRKYISGIINYLKYRSKHHQSNVKPTDKWQYDNQDVGKTPLIQHVIELRAA